MLTIGIEYLNGWALATHSADRESPEWPPHPDRVFMALAAAHFETDGDGKEREVLEWLEGLGDPDLFASPPSRDRDRTSVTTFVPVNDTASPIKKNKPLMTAGSMPIGRDRQPRTFPITIPEDPRVYLQWNVDPTPDQRNRLNALCRKVTSIGHSASLVRMWANSDALHDDGTNGEGKQFKLTPTTGGRFSLRVFGPGRLADLEARYNKAAIEDYAALQRELAESKGKRKKEIKAIIEERYGNTLPQSLRPTSGLWQGYDQIKPEIESPVYPHTHWSSDLIVLRLASGRRFGLATTLQLSQALRNTCMKECPDPIPEWLSGHQPDGKPSQRTQGHVALVPLSHVGREYAGGHLLGLAIAVPRDVPGHELSAAFGKLLFDKTGRPASIELTLGKLGTCVVEMDEQNDFRVALRPETWTSFPNPARRWGTVTPIALDRHAKGSDPWDEICGIIADGCERIGLPRPLDVIPGHVSMFAGAPTAREMPRIHRKSDQGQIRHVHAVLTFPEPVIGPVIVGAGRYRGYGLCRPLTAEVLP